MRRSGVKRREEEGGRREDPICSPLPAPKRKLYIRCMVGHADFGSRSANERIEFSAPTPRKPCFGKPIHACHAGRWSHSETISEHVVIFALLPPMTPARPAPALSCPPFGKGED